MRDAGFLSVYASVDSSEICEICTYFANEPEMKNSGMSSEKEQF
ncbi:MAG: hypothetical protein ACJAYC_002592 [Halieaceae bacterium]|jgi:hypothetical protein